MEKELFMAALCVEEPVYIDEVVFDNASGELHIHMDFRSGGHFACSECGASDLPVHDTTDKVWRHLNFFQYRCYLHMRTPRTRCPVCGTRLWVPPWGRAQSGFTTLFEAFVLVLAKDMPISRIGALVGEHDTRIWRIVRHHVGRAYADKTFESTEQIGCDETSVRKGHKYVTVFADMASGKTLFVAKGRSSGTLEALSAELPKHNAAPEQIREITMDMFPGYILGAAEHFSQAGVTFDKFHVIQALSIAMDQVRREEQKTNPLLKHTRYIWLKNQNNLTAKQKTLLETLRFENLKTAKVYQMKMTFQDIYRWIWEPKAADEAIKKWLSWAVRSRIEPIKTFARLVKRHYAGIIRYFKTRLTTGTMESINSRILEIKRRAKGFRNIDNFISMIYLKTADLNVGIPT